MRNYAHMLADTCTNYAQYYARIMYASLDTTVVMYIHVLAERYCLFILCMREFQQLSSEANVRVWLHLGGV